MLVMPFMGLSTVYADTPGSSILSNPTNDNKAASAAPVTCSIQKMGWILCPVIEVSAKLGDAAFNMLATTFLETEPELIGTSSNGSDPSGTMSAWNQARNLADILFIIAFLIIIISQITGYGISNYGIKKMIPRLIVAAIAVNVSYYICQVMVDLSNIAGFALEDMLNNAAISVTSNSAMPLPSGGQAAGNVLGVIAIGAVAVGSLALIPLCLSGIIMILFTCVAIIFILLMRKAIIVLLVVASPLAFVAYLLPNTEKFFSKWLKMFTQLLMVFPTIGLLIGGGQLASRIILVAGASENQGQEISNQCINFSSNTPGLATCQKAAGGKAGSASLSLGLIAAGVAVAPLLATYSVLQGALSAAGAIGGKIQGAIKSTASGAGKFTAKYTTDPLQKAARDRVTNGAAARWQNMQARGLNGEGGLATRMAGNHARQRAIRNERYSQAKNDLSAREHEAINNILHPEGTADAITSGLSRAGATSARNSATAAHDKLIADEIKAESIRLAEVDRDAAFRDLIPELATEAGRESARSAALIEKVMREGSTAQKRAIVDALRNSGSASLANRTVASSVSANNPGWMGAADIGNLSRGTGKSYDEMALDGISGGKLTAEKLATADAEDLAYVHNLAKAQAMAGNQKGVDALAKMKSAATDATTIDQLKSKIGSNSDAIHNML